MSSRRRGLGIPTTIDVKEILKKKLKVDFNRYIILGAFNQLSPSVLFRQMKKSGSC